MNTPACEMFDRRGFLITMTSGLAAAPVAMNIAPVALAAQEKSDSRHGPIKVTDIEVHDIMLPYEDWIAYQLDHYYGPSRRTVYVAHTDNGLVGLGESNGREPEEVIEKYIGSNPLLLFPKFLQAKNSPPVMLAGISPLDGSGTAPSLEYRLSKQHASACLPRGKFCEFSSLRPIFGFLSPESRPTAPWSGFAVRSAEPFLLRLTAVVSSHSYASVPIDTAGGNASLSMRLRIVPAALDCENVAEQGKLNKGNRCSTNRCDAFTFEQDGLDCTNRLQILRTCDVSGNVVFGVPETSALRRIN